LSTTTYPIVIFRGGMGSGKSFMCRLLQMVIDPCTLGLQDLPKKAHDFAIMAQNSHILFFDNVRKINEYLSDLFCRASTGGTVSQRKLYSDAELVALSINSGLVFNGIHDFGNETDFSQRCIVLDTLPFDERNRKSEIELLNDFEADLPAIMHDLFTLIAEILKYYPDDVEATNPERLIDFVKWLAAMEKVKGIPPGIYQQIYSGILREGQLDSLLDHPLAATVLKFAENLKERNWSGTPTELLVKLNREDVEGMQRSKYWPNNSISLSKKLKSLQAGLLTQEIKIQFSRGKERKITVTDNNYVQP
jgi:hypothetical protein